MKTHTTLTLRTLVLNDMNIEKHKLTKQEISVWAGVLPDVTKEMFETIYFFTHSLFHKSLVRRQIRQIQQECTNLLNQLDKYIDLAPEVDPLKSAVMKCLDTVLDKIETDCPNYFDKEVFMPSSHLKREKVVVESDMTLILSMLKTKEVDGKLQRLIAECMTDLLKSARCYYFRMRYIKKLQEDLIQLGKKTNKSEIDWQLMSHLLRVDYNTAGFAQYYQQKVANELAECIEDEEQFKYLRNAVNTFGNPHFRRAIPSYDDKCRRVNQMLYDFVRLELDVREKRAHQVKMEMRLEAERQADKFVVKDPTAYKVRTTMTVNSLAFFIKLMVKAKVIEPGVRTELLAFFARSFQTPNAGVDGISANSLGTKYKQVIESAVKSVRVLLVRMLKILDEEYG